MLRELIEKIKALKSDHEIDKDLGFLYDTWTLDRIIDMLDELKPKFLDKPNTDGGWWYRDTETGMLSYIEVYKIQSLKALKVYQPNSLGFYYLHPSVPCDYKHTPLGYDNPVSWLKGKWIKAETPELE